MLNYGNENLIIKECLKVMDSLNKFELNNRIIRFMKQRELVDYAVDLIENKIQK